MESLVFIFVWLLLAALGFLISAPFFRSLPDKGLGFAPWIGLFSIAFPSWWLGHSGYFQLSTISTWFLFALYIALVMWAVRTERIKIEDYRFNPAFLFFHFSVWLILYFAYTWFYGNKPNIEDIEKLPDLAMLVSSFRAKELPPVNVFASDQVLNYYYFGFYKVASFAHFAAAEAWKVFNPMKAILLATASTSFASAAILILSRLLKSDKFRTGYLLLGGFFSFLMANLIGNFHTIYHQVILKTGDFWYPTPTRYIENTIHEFPLYSFIIGDLHAHLIALPTTGLMLALTFLYAEKLSKQVGSHFKDILKSTWQNLLPLCLVYGLCYASNSWDIFTGLLLVGFLTWFLLKEKSLFSYNTLLNTGLLSLTYVALAVLFFLPFWILFEPISSGLEHVPPDKSSPFTQLVVIWLIHASFPLIFLCIERSKELPFRFLRTLSALGLGLIIFMEYFYFKDIYTVHLRANTMFKIGLQIWLWFSVATSCYFIYVLAESDKFFKTVRQGLISLFAFLVFSGLVYSHKAIRQYIDVNKVHAVHKDGMSYLKSSFPEDYEIIQWLKQNEPEQAVVLTGVGDSFNGHGAINAFTGNPTVLTWYVHNWLWHGSEVDSMKPMSKMEKRTGATDSVSLRRMEVQRFYESKDEYVSRVLIQSYRIKYVVVSDRERKLYKNLNEELIQSYGKVVYTKNGTTLYQVSKYGPE